MKIFPADGGEEQLLETIDDHMPLFKSMMYHPSPQEIDQLATKYLGFNRFANLLESLAATIADGRINSHEFEC